NGTSNGQYHSTNLHHAATGNVLTNSNAANLIETINQHVLASAAGQNGGGQHQQQQQQWIATRPHRKRGPDLLYSYLEADGSDSGDYARYAPQPAAHSLAATILRTAPPSAVEEDNRREADAARQDTAPSTQAEQFSLTEFLKSHTEVSISTVGGKGAEDESPVTIIPLPLVADRQQTPEMKETEEQQKVLLEGERNPRKRYQPRRIGESDELPDPPPSDDPMAFVAVEMLDTSIETASKSPEPKEQAEEQQQQQQQQEGKAIDLKVQKQATPAEKPQATVSRLADIRDKHMIKLITNRRCCRICRTSGLLDHLDNAHYHSRMSLFLHTLWRHRRSSAGMCECRKCGAQFARRYMLALHQKLTKHTGMIVQAENGSKRVSKRATKRTAIKKSSSSSKHVAGARKQRKRKPRSRCFTAKRKK
uniref:C2H2-type domain-containing protein n=1 Tax=Anopheles melas TaxID=34690 RepID=A0A182UKC8_9DIPT